MPKKLFSESFAKIDWVGVKWLGLELTCNCQNREFRPYLKMSLNKRTVPLKQRFDDFFSLFFVEDELLDKAFKEVPDTSEDKPNETDSNKKDIDFTSLKSLEKDGIDMSFLESLQKYNDQSTGNWVDDTQ